jgi:beta-aspartyl-peptidase (threonine type)
MKNIPTILVHGGAGPWEKDPRRLIFAKTACKIAVQTGQAVLLDGGNALDAVEAAVRVLEDDPTMDAGRGSYLNAHGEIELDAMIMDGRTLNIGAVASVKRVRNPISLARTLLALENTNFLVGIGAESYADSIDFPRCNFEDLLVDPDFWLNDSNGLTSDTVGAVARDAFGNLAAATSTGGTRGKLPGRVGDSPLVGSGAYADNLSAAVSATGHGEDLMKIVISKLVCDFVTAGLSAREACISAIRILDKRVGGSGGLIAVDKDGEVGFAYNTNAMPLAYATGEDAIKTGQ